MKTQTLLFSVAAGFVCCGAFLPDIDVEDLLRTVGEGEGEGGEFHQNAPMKKLTTKTNIDNFIPAFIRSAKWYNDVGTPTCGSGNDEDFLGLNMFYASSCRKSTSPSYYYRTLYRMEDCAYVATYYPNADCSGSITGTSAILQHANECRFYAPYTNLKSTCVASLGPPLNGKPYLYEKIWTGACDEEPEEVNHWQSHWHRTIDICSPAFLKGKAVSFKNQIEDNRMVQYIYEGDSCAISPRKTTLEFALDVCEDGSEINYYMDDDGPLETGKATKVTILQQEQICLWQTNCFGEENGYSWKKACEKGTHCASFPYWSQCQEDAGLPTDHCFATNDGPYGGKRWGCNEDSDCCNPSAKCGSDRLCRLPCD